MSNDNSSSNDNESNGLVIFAFLSIILGLFFMADSVEEGLINVAIFLAVCGGFIYWLAH